MLTAPIPATREGARASGLPLDDIGAFEVNEAFAPVPLAWLADLGADAEALNPNGGAIALGHPLGGSGARLMTTLVHHMQATRHPLRPADHVRGRRAGQRHHPGAAPADGGPPSPQQGGQPVHSPRRTRRGLWRSRASCGAAGESTTRRSRARTGPSRCRFAVSARGVVKGRVGSRRSSPSTFTHRCVHSWGRSSRRVVTPVPFLSQVSHDAHRCRSGARRPPGALHMSWTTLRTTDRHTCGRRSRLCTADRPARL